MSLGAALTVLFVGLKLGSVISWGWPWVLSPLLIGLFFDFAIFLVFANRRQRRRDGF
jgi:hypothetical protein